MTIGKTLILASAVILGASSMVLAQAGLTGSPSQNAAASGGPGTHAGAVRRRWSHPIILPKFQSPKIGFAEARRIFEYGFEHRLEVAGRRTDDAQYLRWGFLPLQRLVALAGETHGLCFLAGRCRTTTGRGFG